MIFLFFSLSISPSASFTECSYLQAVHHVRVSGSLVLNNEEKEIIISSICISIAGLLKLTGGRWKNARELARETLLIAFPLLSYTSTSSTTSISTSNTTPAVLSTTFSSSKSNHQILSLSVLSLLRYSLTERLPVDSIFISCQKDKNSGGGSDSGKKGSAQGSAQGSANGIQSVVVEGQWVGGMLGNSTSSTTAPATSTSTPSALAALQRKMISLDSNINEWETLGLILCLKNLTKSVTNKNEFSNAGGGKTSITKVNFRCQLQ